MKVDARAPSSLAHYLNGRFRLSSNGSEMVALSSNARTDLVQKRTKPSGAIPAVRHSLGRTPMYRKIDLDDYINAMEEAE